MPLVPFIPQPLIKDIADGRCIPFVGAGFSKNAIAKKGTSLPNWRELTQELSEEMGDVLATLTGAEIAQEYENRFGRVYLLEAVAKAIERCDPHAGLVHESFARLPFDIVYTTNFDRLLERAYEQVRLPVITIASDSAMSFLGERKSVSVIKMHGDIDHRDNMVVTTADYASYLSTHPVISTHLSSMFITKTILYIGYSLSDSNVQSINSVIRERLGNFKRRSYWIGFDITRADIDSLVKLLEGEKVNVVSISTESNNVSKTELLLSVLRDIEGRINASRPNLPENLRVQSIRGRGLL